MIKLLPEFIQLSVPLESEEWKRRIFENLPKAIKSNDFLSIDFWINSVECFVGLSLYTFTKLEIENLANLLFDFIVDTDDVNLMFSAIDLFKSIVNPQKMNLDLKFDWRKVYRVFYDIFISKQKIKMKKYPSKLKNIFPSFVGYVRNYFDENALIEMLEEWDEMLNPTTTKFILGHCLCVLFFPVHHNQHNLWIDKFLNYWCLYNSELYDFQFFSLFSRLAQENYDDIKWNIILPLLFNKITNYLNVPEPLIQGKKGTLTSYQADSYSFFFVNFFSITNLFNLFCDIILSVLTTKYKDLTKSCIEKIIHLIKPSCTIDNKPETSRDIIIEFLNVLISEYIKRINRDKKYSSKLEKITEVDNEWFVNLVLPLVVMEQYRDEQEIQNIQLFVQLSPETIIPQLINTIHYSLEFPHLKSTAYSCLRSITPIICNTNICSDEYWHILENNVIDDISFLDLEKSSQIFIILILLSTSTKFTDDKESFVLTIIEKLITFCENLSKSDADSKLKTISSIIHYFIKASSPLIVQKLSLLFKKYYQTLPSNLLMIVVGIEKISLPFYSEIAISANNLKSYCVLLNLIKKNRSYLYNNSEKLMIILENGLKDDNKKIRNITIDAIKHGIKNTLSTSPFLPGEQGIIPDSNIEIKWYVPDDDILSKTEEFFESFTKIMEELFHSNLREKQLSGCKLAKALVKILLCCLTDIDIGCNYENERFSEPILKKKTFQPLSKYLKQIADFILNEIETNNYHVSIIQKVLKVLYLIINQKDPICDQVPSFSNQYSIMKELGALTIYKDFYNGHSPIINYWKGLSLYGYRQSLPQVYLTDLTKEIIPRVLMFSTCQYKQVRNEAIMIFQNALAIYRQTFDELFENKFKEFFLEGLDTEKYNGLCSLGCSILNIDIDYKMLRMISEISLAVCQQLPQDISESVQQLQQAVIICFDQLDPLDPNLSNDKCYEIRLSLAKEAINRYLKYPALHDLQNYAIALVCSVFCGERPLLDFSICEFLISILTTDDCSICDCLHQVIPLILELLIPREPRRNGIVVDEVNSENYDYVSFKDRLFPSQSKHQTHFLTRQEYEDPKVISLFFKDNPEERVRIHKIFFHQIIDNFQNIEIFISNSVNAQICKEENFSKIRVNFWCSLFRFFGLTLIEKIMNLFDKMIESSSNTAQQVIAAEIFSGLLHSLKDHNFKYMTECSKYLFPLIKKLIQNVDLEFHSIWFYAFSTSLTNFDPRRFYWLFDYMLESIPTTDPIKSERSISLLSDIFSEISFSIVNLRNKLSDIIYKNLTLNIQTKQTKESSALSLLSLIYMYFDENKRGNNQEVKDLLEKLLCNSSQMFVIKWLSILIDYQNLGTISSSGYLFDNFSKFCNFLADVSDDDEMLLKISLFSLIDTNWIGSICKLPPTNENVQEIINKMIKNLLSASNHWQITSIQLILVESFISSLIFYINESTLKNIIDQYVIPNLNHSHSDVQESASHLLSYIVKTSIEFKTIIPNYIEKFKCMLYDRKSLSNRIAGANGISSIIMGTVLFDNVPQYVIDGFNLLSDALEVDSSVDNIINKFLSDFWALHDNNLMKEIRSILSPFQSSLRPSYFC